MEILFLNSLNEFLTNIKKKNYSSGVFLKDAIQGVCLNPLRASEWAIKLTLLFPCLN